MKKGFIIDVTSSYRGFNDFAHYVNMDVVLYDADESDSDMYADNYKLAYVFKTKEHAEMIAEEIKNVFRSNYEGTINFDKSGVLCISIIATEEFDED